MDVSAHVKVTGPGMVINYELEVIKRAFESLGIKVIVKNEFPDKDINLLMERVNPKNRYTVVLEADHQPWGG